MDPLRRATLAVQRCRTRHAPDDRVAVFEVRVEADPPRLTGTVSEDRFRERAHAAASDALDEPLACDVTVLDAVASPATTGERGLAVRSDPNADAERVTELRYGSAVTAFDAAGGWQRVRAADDYLGWVRANALAEPVASTPTATWRRRTAPSTASRSRSRRPASTSARAACDSAPVRKPSSTQQTSRPQENSWPTTAT